MTDAQLLTITTHNADETRELGRKLGMHLIDPATPAPLILLRGDYGTGKTTFVQGLAAGLGVTEPTRSPSYLIVKVYLGATRTLLHGDLYRVHSAAEVDELGIPELAGPDGVVAIEWPGEAAGLLAGEARPVVTIELEYADTAAVLSLNTENRTLTFQTASPALAEVLRAAAAG